MCMHVLVCVRMCNFTGECIQMHLSANHSKKQETTINCCTIYKYKHI